MSGGILPLASRREPQTLGVAVSPWTRPSDENGRKPYFAPAKSQGQDDLGLPIMQSLTDRELIPAPLSLRPIVIVDDATLDDKRPFPGATDDRSSKVCTRDHFGAGRLARRSRSIGKRPNG